MRLLIILFLIFLSFGTGAQSLFEKEWTTTSNAIVTDIIFDENDNIYASSSIYSIDPDTSAALVLKFNSAFELEWSKRFKILTKDDMGSLHLLNDGNILAGGRLNAFFSPFIGASLYKINSEGELLWNKAYPGTGDDRLSHIFELSNGELFLGIRRGVTGQFTRMIHADEEGSIINQFSYSCLGEAVKFESIRQVGDVFFGTASVFDENLNYSVGLLMCFDTEEVLWARFYDPGSSVESLLMKILANGDFLITSGVDDPQGLNTGVDLWVSRLNNNGEVIWSKHIYRDNASATEFPSNSIALDDGGFLFAQRHFTAFGGVAVISRFDADGNLIWIKNRESSFLTYFDLLSDGLVLSAGRGTNGGLGFGTSTLNGETACGEEDIEIEVVDLTISESDVDVIINTSGLGEESAEVLIHDFPLVENDLCQSSVSTSDTRSKDFRIYPNPFDRFVKIEAETNMKSVSVVDLQGREFVHNREVGREFVLDLNNLSQGMYLLYVNGVLVERLIKSSIAD